MSNGIMRALVVEDVDPLNKDRLGIYIPQLMERYENSQSGLSDGVYNYSSSLRNLPFDEVSEVKEASSSVKVSEYLWANCSNLLGEVGSSIIPKKNQVIFCFMENDDPKKLFWLPLSPNLKNSNRSFPLSITQEKGTHLEPETRKNITLLVNLPGGNVIGFDLNEESNTFEIDIKGTGKKIILSKNEDTDRLRLQSENMKITLDEKNKVLSIDSSYRVYVKASKELDVFGEIVNVSASQSINLG